MTKTTYQTYTNTAGNGTGMASAVAYANGGYALAANGAADNLGHLITFKNKSGNDHSGKTLTIAGTNANARPLTETLAGPAGNATVTFAGYYNTVSSIAISATTNADTFDIGWTADAVGAEIYPELTRVPVINIEVFCRVPSGNATYAVQYTADATPAGLDSTSWLTHSTITGKTATFDGQITIPVRAIRLHPTTAGPVNMTVIEPFQA